jgi:putative ABC transport system permease protein
MTLFGLALRSMARRSTRTILTMLGIALAVGSAIALFALAGGIKQSTDEGLDERGASLVVTQRGITDLFGSSLPEALEGALKAVPGVAGVSGELIQFWSLPEGRHILTTGWSRDSFAWPTVPLAAGRLPVHDGTREVVIGESLSQALGKGIGDTLSLFDEDFTVVGISRYKAAFNRGVAIMPLGAMQDAAVRPGRVTVFHIRHDRGLGASGIETLMQALGKAGPVTVSTTREVLDGDRNMQVLEAVSLAVSLIALLTAALNVFNTLLISVSERTREIGMLAAIGWSDRLIVRLILTEGMLLGAAGCVLGVGLGMLLSRGFRAIPTIGNYLSFNPSAEAILPPLAAALVLCLIGSLYPAIRATRLHPADALRAV